MNIRLLFLSLFFMGSIFSGYSQKDANAKKILDVATEKYYKAKGISADFTFNLKNTTAKTTESFDGVIQMEGTRFYLSVPDADTWFDGKTQWVWLKGSDEVNITEPSDRDVAMMNPATILAIYKIGCDYSYKGKKNDLKNRMVHEIEMIPEQKDRDIKKLIVHINDTDHMPVMFHLFYDHGIENVIHLNKYTTGLNLQKKTFVFDRKQHPNAEIIDLR